MGKHVPKVAVAGPIHRNTTTFARDYTAALVQLQGQTFTTWDVETQSHVEAKRLAPTILLNGLLVRKQLKGDYSKSWLSSKQIKGDY